jgi:hypothetical protein
MVKKHIFAMLILVMNQSQQTQQSLNTNVAL